MFSTTFSRFEVLEDMLSSSASPSSIEELGFGAFGPKAKSRPNVTITAARTSGLAGEQSSVLVVLIPPCSNGQLLVYTRLTEGRKVPRGERCSAHFVAGPELVCSRLQI
ncbi:hypothetical protein FS749_010055 [Ceratobasidium sp. UAMH 11750]|nr:hypothetical protein FS749_010055 [Ceratobasidium sp. UAMH 11750]